MGFLNWLKSNEPEDDLQLTLSGDSQPLTPRKRIDGAIVNRGFRDAIKEAKGSSGSYPRAIEAETQELFDCSMDELYKGTQSRKGDRSTLPLPAQAAYLVNETLSKHRIQTDVAPENQKGGSQQMKDDRIVEAVQDTAQNVRNWFPW